MVWVSLDVDLCGRIWFCFVLTCAGCGGRRQVYNAQLTSSGRMEKELYGTKIMILIMQLILLLCKKDLPLSKTRI